MFDVAVRTVFSFGGYMSFLRKIVLYQPTRVRGICNSVFEPLYYKCIGQTEHLRVVTIAQKAEANFIVGLQTPPGQAC